jgi:hypothetical protein
VYADCVSEDGLSGFIIRLGRYPEHDTSWLWSHCFLSGKMHAFNDHYLPCPEGSTRVEGEDATYSLPGEPSVLFKRSGQRNKPAGASVRCRVMAHPEPHAPYGNGPIPLYIEVELLLLHQPWRPNKYRSEWVGEVKGKINIAGSVSEIHGLGQWHEQHQKAPRWQTPFIYITLRGRDLAVIATAMRGDDAGHVLRGSDILRVSSITIDPPGRTRNFTFDLEDGSQVRGKLETTYEYSVPIYDKRRPGTLVTAEVEGEKLSGCVNDWVIE